MPEEMRDAYEIELRLKSNWSAVLGKQSRQFENFVKKANRSTVSLEKSITSMHTNLSKTYEGMFKNSHKQMEGMANFAKKALTDVSTSTIKIMDQVQRGQDKVDQLMSRNIDKAKQYAKLAQDARVRGAAASKDPGIAKGAFEAKAKQFDKIGKQLERQVDKMAEYQANKVSQMLGEHFRKLGENILKESSMVSKSTKAMVDDSINQWKRIKNLGFMDTATSAAKKAGGIGDMVTQQKQVYANLAQMRGAYLSQVKVFEEHQALMAGATSKKVKQYHADSAFIALQNLKKIAKEHKVTAIEAERFTEVIKAQRQQLAGSKGMGDLLKGWKDQLKPSRVKALMQPLIANVAESGMLAGKGFSDKLMKSIGKGDALQGRLDAFKNKLVEVKQQADSLIKAGLIKPGDIIPKIKKVETVLKEYENQLKRTRQEYAKFSPKGKAQLKIDDTLGDASKIRQGVRTLTNELGKAGKITKDNFEATYRNVQKIKTALEQHVKARSRLSKKLVDIQAEEVRVSKQLAQTKNQQLRASMEAYIRRLRKYSEEINAELNRSVKLDKKKLRVYETALLNSVRQTMGRIRAITSGKTYGTPDQMFTGIRKQYELLSKQIDKLKTKRFISKKSIEEGKAKVDELKKKVVNYKTVLIKLQEEYRRLQRLQRAGFSNKGIRQQKALLQEQIAAMRTHSAEVQRMSHHASRRIEQVQTSSVKGFLKRSWEMIRNFRWQVAAVIYLISRAVQAVKRVFMDTMGEIAKFRRDSMALAAQYSFKMFGDMQKNFTNAYKFSRDLMMKLEIVAAETILTLDDMLMLTKTFAQAGIIPRTDEDLHRIATIGTAIKALTEGMANAGVQMKQELYAIIAGRQRATDQLAMMFKLMGKDIQQMIDDGKAKGKEMIEVLADALKPFSVMNNALKDEWEAVINKLQIVWKMLKRFALEDALLKSTKSLKELIETFWNKSEGLTEKGRQAAAALRAGWDVIKLSVIEVYEISKLFLITLGSVAKVTLSLLGLSSQIGSNTEGIDGAMKGFLQSMELLLKVTYVTGEGFRVIFALINALIQPISWVISAFKAGATYLASWQLYLKSFTVLGAKNRAAFREAAKELKEMAGAEMSGANKEYMDAQNELWKIVGNLGEGYKDITATVERWVELTKEVKKETATLGQEFKLTYPTGVFDEWAKMQGEMKRAEAAQYKGPKRFQIEADQKIAALDELKFRTNKNIQDLTEMFAAYHSGVLKMTKEQAVEMQRSWDEHIGVLGKVIQYEQWVRNEQFRLTDEWNKKEEISLARRKRKYEQFMREVTQTPMTPREKAKDWFDQKKIDLKELIISSEFFRNNIEEVDKALETGLKLRDDNAIKQMNLEFDKFIAKASKANAWNNVFDELNTEFAEYVRQIEKSNDLDKEKKEELRKQLEIIKAQRAEQEKLNIAYESYLTQLDLQSKKAAYLKGSYSPIKQRKGEIMDLKATHNRAMAEMKKKLEDYNLKWKQNGEWKTEATAAVRAEGEAIDEMMVQMTKITERELQKKQMPIWNDLVEASNGWADGFTDALSNIVDGVGSVKEALNELQIQILKDTVKVLVKNVITDNLQDMLGTGLLGESTLFQKMFGKGKGKGKEKAMEITAKKPLPVYITNPPGTVPGAEGGGKIGELGKGTLRRPVPVFVTNGLPGMEGGLPGGTATAAAGVQGVSQDLADISKEIADNTKEAEESSDSWVDKMKDGFSSIGSKISDWLSAMNSSGGGGGGGGGSWFGKLFSMGATAVASYYGGPAAGAGASAGTSTIRGGEGGGYGFAKGGLITEPIVGKGLKSGEIYNFGENTKYGENEIVSPMRKMQKTSGGNKTEYHMPIHLSAIDTQSGVQFLMQHSDVIQGQMTKSLKQNKPIRKGIQNAY